MSPLTQILAFHRVAAAGSFTAAANLGGVSQPTLSAHVRALEQAVGKSLFERRGRRIRLTPTGERLFESTQRLATALDEVEALIASTGRSARGTLRVSADSANHVLPVLAALKQRSSAFHFSLQISNSAEVIAQVLTDATDVAVTARPVDDPRLFAMRLRDDRLTLIVASGDPMATRRDASLADLAGRDLVLRERGSITREAAEAALLQAGVTTGAVFEVESREAVRETVAAGFGIGLVFASETGVDPRIVSLPLGDAGVAVSEYAICRAERRRIGLVARFLDTAQRVAVNEGWLNSA